MSRIGHPKTSRKKGSFIKTVMVFGTFDVLHNGHKNFFKQAKKYGNRLVISVARDINVKKIKGAEPVYNEKTRLKNLQNLKIADKLVLGDRKFYINHIKKINPDYIALGYDQSAYTKSLKADLKKAGLAPKIVRLKPYRPSKYKSSKLKLKML